MTGFRIGALVATALAVGVSGCGMSLPSLTGSETSAGLQYLRNDKIARVGLVAVSGLPSHVSDRLRSHLVSSASEHGIVVFPRPTVVQPHSLRLSFQAEQIQGRFHIYYQADVLAKSSPSHSLKGEEVVPLSGNDAAEPATTQKTIVVVRGDTLSRLAARHRVSIAELKSANNLTSHIIRIGQKLKLPTEQPSLRPTRSPNPWAAIPPNHLHLLSQKILRSVSRLIQQQKV